MADALVGLHGRLVVLKQVAEHLLPQLHADTLAGIKNDVLAIVVGGGADENHIARPDDWNAGGPITSYALKVELLSGPLAALALQLQHILVRTLLRMDRGTQYCEWHAEYGWCAPSHHE